MERRLRRLGATWRILQDMPPGHGPDVEHVIFGRPGVFVLEPQQLSSPVARSVRTGHGATSVVPVIPSIAHEASRVGRVLSRASGREVVAWPLKVSVTGALQIRNEGYDVHVVSEQLLVPWLKSLQDVLTDEEVALLYALAREPSTWNLSQRE